MRVRIKKQQGVDDVELWNREDADDLNPPAEAASRRITVSSRDWTVETIVSQIEQQNIDLDPAFQRRNAWRDHRRSRLIESFVLGFPVPQIVLAENPRQQGSFIVIDGKQRLMTIAGLYLPEYRNYWNQPRLTGLHVLTELNGVSLDDFLTDATHSKEKRRLGNADIRTTVVTGFQDESILYDIFYRINTGSVPLSTQELRQVLNRGEFARYLLNVTSETNPLWTLLNIDAPDARLRDVELLLRLVSWRRFSSQYRGNLKAFLDESMIELNNEWPSERGRTEDLVSQLFKAVDASVKIYGDYVGRKFTDDKYERQFNRALFEVQAYFLSMPAVRSAAIAKRQAVLQRSKALFGDSDFLRSIETTTKSLENYRTRFSQYHAMLEKTLGIKIEAPQLGPAKK